MDLLQPVVQPYAWGSTRAIAELQGRPVPSPGPEAELWMGAHPSAPSGVERGGRRTTLDALVAADPAAELGRECARRFGGRLPFLLKILAAECALSIQVHPDRDQAVAGFRAEHARRVAGAARNYSDDWPKPEVLCALTPFEALAGLRTPRDAAALLTALDTGWLRPLAADLAAGDEPGRVAGALERLLTWPAGERAALVEEVVAGCARLAGEGGPYAAACDAVVRIAADHPADLGVAAALLMRHTVLEPGQAVFMPAGGLHAYVRGVGVELLANSDNVVRAGLTGKHVDVPELLRLVDPAVDVPVLRARRTAEGVAVYDTPVPEFRLYRVEPGSGPSALPGTGPRIVLCAEGAATLRDAAGRTLRLRRGQSCFVRAADGAATASGPALLFTAATGT